MFSCTFQCCTKLLRKHGQHIMAHRISFINQYRLRFLIQHIVVFSVCYHIFQIRHDPLLTSLLLRLRQYTHNRHIKAARLLQFAAVFSDHIAVCPASLLRKIIRFFRTECYISIRRCPSRNLLQNNWRLLCNSKKQFIFLLRPQSLIDSPRRANQFFRCQNFPLTDRFIQQNIQKGNPLLCTF